MKAIVYDGEVKLVKMDVPQPGPGEALVRVLAAGVCNTDIEIVKGYMDFKGVLGHEFVGIVEHSSSGLMKGKRVVGEINCVCHECPYCRMEMPHHCMSRTVVGIVGRHGAFAQYLCIPEENLHLAPDAVRDEEAVFVEPLAAAFRIVEQIAVTPSDRVIVLGDGKLGQLVAQVLWLYTKRLTCVGKHDWKLRLLQRLGIGTANADEPLERGADIVVEATGSADGLRRALELVRPEGTVVLKTTVAGEAPVNFAAPVINEVKIVGSRCGPFRPAIEALAMGTVNVLPLVTAVYELDDGPMILERATFSDNLKVLIKIA